MVLARGGLRTVQCRCSSVARGFLEASDSGVLLSRHVMLSSHRVRAVTAKERDAARGKQEAKRKRDRSWWTERASWSLRSHRATSTAS